MIPLWADLIAVGLGGIQGALFASGFRGQRRLDLLGVAIIGIVMGMGGGLIRDLLLNVTPVTLQSNWYLLTATGAALVGMLLAGVFHRLNAVIVGLDALVIGLFGAFGTSKALALGFPLVPAVFVGVCSAVGGGLIRDILLNVNPVTLQSNWYLLTATGAALIGMLLAGLFQRLNAVIVGLDALVIGLFGAFGTSKALVLGLPLVPAVFVGVCAAVGGGILRDMIMGLPVAIMHVGSLYAVAAAVGCFVLATCDAFGVNLVLAAVIGVAVTAVIRLLAVIFDISLPEQRALYRRKVAVETSAIPTVKP